MEWTHFSLSWREHFRRSLAEPLDAPVRDRWIDGHLADSLRQFQLGESSEGRHLLGFARQAGARDGDPWLGEAMALFIQEENRHAHWLAEFLRAQGEPLLRRHWLDGLFREVRKPLGFGGMAAVLTCAEIVAVPYYDAVRKSTSSPWLRAICGRLLRDEAHHLQFQAMNLARCFRLGRLFPAAHGVFQVVTCVAVWTQHGKVLRQGGYPFSRFVTVCLGLLDEVHEEAGRLLETAISNNPPASIAQVPGSGISARPL